MHRLLFFILVLFLIYAKNKYYYARVLHMILETVHDNEIFIYNLDPNNPDFDDDGGLDGEELFSYSTDPKDPDNSETGYYD